MEPPLGVKATVRGDALELLLVGSAASLLEGDDLRLDISVSGAAPVVVRSVAAQVAHPCPNGGATRQEIRVNLSGGARLFWSVEPLIVSGGADHTNALSVDTDGESAAVVVDSVLLGRTNEDPASAILRAHMMCRSSGEYVFEDGLDTSLSASHGPAGLHGRRYVSSLVALGWRPRAQPPGAMPLAGNGVVFRSLSVDAAEATRAMSDTGAAWWHELLQYFDSKLM